jgi:transposase
VPAPFSLGLRLRVVAACQAGELTQPELAELFQIHLKTVEKYWKLRRTTGSLQPQPHRGGWPARLVSVQEQLRAWAVERNDRTLAEWVKLVRQRTGIQTSVQALSRTLRQLGLPLKQRRSRLPNDSGPK